MAELVVAGTNAPLCPTCGYSLLGLTEYRCPECGEAFDAEYVEDASFRANLLPWERPETGAVLRRLGRTLVQAAFHPERFFASVSLRKDRRIAHAGRLVAAFLLLSGCFFGVEYLVTRTAHFLRLLAKYNRPALAFESVMHSESIGGWSWLVVCLMQVSCPLLFFMVAAALIRWMFGGRLGSLRWIDLVAVFSPVIAIVAFFAACAMFVGMMSFRTIDFVFEVMDWAQTAVLLLLLWSCCRRLLLLSRWVSVSLLLVGCVLQDGSDRVVTALLKPVMLW